MNAVDGEEAKAGKRAGNYGVCKEKFLYGFSYAKKRKSLSAVDAFDSCQWKGKAHSP